LPNSRDISVCSARAIHENISASDANFRPRRQKYFRACSVRAQQIDDTGTNRRFQRPQSTHVPRRNPKASLRRKDRYSSQR